MKGGRMKIFKVFYILVVLWGVDKFILSNLKFQLLISEPAMVTAIVCCTIALVAVVFPVIISKN